jgi:isopentenyl diphosphate isomerase/L-lactate dehydrogenase-like FMN-dependent dehydrogenase
MAPGATWQDVRWLRDEWDGPLVVKGVMTPADAANAFDRGADAVICSNHGGRILDGVDASLGALPSIAEVAAKRRKEVLLDGGVRTGADIVKAIALGARAVLAARPFWWGLAVGGEAGVSQVFDILTRELDSTMTMMGRASIAELGHDAVRALEIPFSTARPPDGPPTVIS